MSSGIVSKALFTSPKKGCGGEGEKKNDCLAFEEFIIHLEETMQAYKNTSEGCNVTSPSVNQKSFQ